MPATFTNSEKLFAHSAHPDTSSLLLRILNWIADKRRRLPSAVKLRGSLTNACKDMAHPPASPIKDFYGKYGKQKRWTRPQSF